MGRLVVFLYGMVVIQSVFFAALPPLLPAFEEALGLSKAQAGLLVGIFPIGQGISGLPIGLLGSRAGVKRIAIAGLVTLAVASVVFGLVDSYGALLAARFVQGVAGGACLSSALAWLVGAAPRDQRGKMVGLLVGAGAAGQMLGPAVGASAVLVGRAEVFAGVAGFALLLGIVGARFPGPVKSDRQALALISKAHRSRTVLIGLWLVALPALLLGTVFALAPLHLSRLGWGPVGIAGTFLVAAMVGVVARPLIGRWADRRGLLGAIRPLLLTAVPVTLVIPWLEYPWALSACVVCAVSVYGVQIGPALALVSTAYESARVAQVLGFGIMNLVIGIGFLVGSAAGGEIARLAGDGAAYALAAGMCLATFAAVKPSPGARVPRTA